MISAFSLGARVFQSIDPSLAAGYLTSATRAASFLLTSLRDRESGALLRRWRDGAAAVPAFLDDYAHTTIAFIDLYEATFNPAHLETALDLAHRAVSLFEDPEHGGFFSSAAASSDLILRLKDDYDGAEPSGNSTLVMALLRIAAYTREPRLQDAAERALQAFAVRLNDQGPTLPAMLSAYMFHLAPKTQVVFAASSLNDNIQALASSVARRFLPEATLLAAIEGPTRDALANWLPEVAAMSSIGGLAAAYLCRDFACLAPVTSPEELAKLLN